MQKWIATLFKEYLEENPFPLTDKQSQEDFKTEWEIFNTLYETLDSEKGELFLKYVRLRDTRTELEQQACYQQGIKTAIRFIMDSLKE